MTRSKGNDEEGTGANVRLGILNTLRCEFPPHLSYSPDGTPLYYHLFDDIKCSLEHKTFTNIIDLNLLFWDFLDP
uniref:Ovule protein n=1 Tax=Strongyloides venezuelensis TaxID=75913 RepID=A0A0K0FQR8_STRVS